MEFTHVPSEVLAGLQPIVRHDIAWWEAVLTAFCGVTSSGVFREEEIPQSYTLDELVAAYNDFYHPEATWNGAVRDGQPALWVASDDQLGQIGSRVRNRIILLSREGAMLLGFVLAANKKDRQVRRTDEEFAALRTAFEQEQLEEGARVKGLEAQLLADNGVLYGLLWFVGEYHKRPAEEIESVTRIAVRDSNATWDLCTALYQALRRREAQDAGRQDNDGDTSERPICGESHGRILTEQGFDRLIK